MGKHPFSGFYVSIIWIVLRYDSWVFKGRKVLQHMLISFVDLLTIARCCELVASSYRRVR